ncbi:hypothetical protein BDY24DRAFT_381946 [Mrakia frigida]|uniref:uncharacterized protein n=1 Tax=Mrakia frigida TaxID=29902 RepID=UPI003FCC1D9F
MLSSSLLASFLLVLPLSVVAQNSSSSRVSSGAGGNSTATSVAPVISQSYSLFETLVVNGTVSSQVTTSVLVNYTVAANTQTTAAAASSTSTTPTTLPFAPSTVNAGSAETQTAAAPGQSGFNSGPDDAYTAGASRGVIVGGATLAVALVAGGLSVLM